MSPTPIGRRRLLGGAAGLALGTAAASGCSTTKSTNNSPQANSGVTIPAYVASTLVKPDLAPTTDGVLPGYLAYPKEPVAAVEDKPGRGGEVSTLTFTYDPIAPALAENAYWRSVNSALGVDLKISYVRDADYQNRFSTAIAGGDLPDAVLIRPPQPNLPQLLSSTFQDLSEYLSGDAVKKYPSLAALPTISWRSAVYNGGIYGVPIPRSIVGGVMFGRFDIIDTKGLPSSPANYEEFVALVKGLTDPKKNQWAIAESTSLLNFIRQIMHIPAGWSERDGKFTHSVESDEFVQALEHVHALVKHGVVHPDGAVSNNNQRNSWFTNGTIALNVSGYAGWFKYIDWGKDIPGYRVGGLVAPGYDGGKGKHSPGTVSVGFLALKPAPKDRIEEILRILNWLATPFGSTEYLLRRYGLKDTHYTLSGTDPVLNDLGTRETTTPTKYLADSESVIYEPGNSEAARSQHSYQEEIVPGIEPDPTIGLFSNTVATKGSQIGKILTSAQADIFASRKPVSSWTTTVQQWRQQGGDQIRAELEEQFSQNR